MYKTLPQNCQNGKITQTFWAKINNFFPALARKLLFFNLVPILYLALRASIAPPDLICMAVSGPFSLKVLKSVQGDPPSLPYGPSSVRISPKASLMPSSLLLMEAALLAISAALLARLLSLLLMEAALLAISAALLVLTRTKVKINTQTVSFVPGLFYSLNTYMAAALLARLLS